MLYVVLLILYLLYKRIKSMPYMLDEKKYMERQKENLDKMQVALKDVRVFGNDYYNTTIKGCMVLCALVETFMIIFYFLLGVELGNPFFAVLSSLEVGTCIMNYKIEVFDDKMFEFDFKNVRYHKYWILFNIVLDYVYYFMALYLLLIK